MNRDNTPWGPLAAAEVTWKADNCPSSDHFDDFYYSSADGVEESHYVFLEGNKLAQRWPSHPHPSFCIVETGFGSGLNFLLTWQLWRNQAEPRPQLHYISIENRPINRSDIAQAQQSWPELKDLATALLECYPAPIPGQHRTLLDDGRVILDLWWEDAQESLAELASYGHQQVDAWYLDGFTPSRNPDIWTNEIFTSLAQLSRPRASFATFTAASEVRRGLQKVGFEVSKRPGYGKKRECMHGVIEQLSPPSISGKSNTVPWDITLDIAPRPPSVLVIGAGLAGCTTAAALAKRGIKVTVLERQSMAGAGSGNDQGVLYTRLSTKHSHLSDFSLQSFLFANRVYQQMLSEALIRDGVDGALCGTFHQSHKTAEMTAIASVLQSIPDVASVFNPTEANSVLGIEQSMSGYWFPGSGWMRPSAICQALLQHPLIELIEHTGEIRLEQNKGGWGAFSDTKQIGEAQCVVLATGTATTQFTGLDWLPLQAIRGQTTNLPSGQAFGSLRGALCHKGYIAPAREGQHCIGATFDIKDEDINLRTSDHQWNLDILASAVPAWQQALDEIEVKSLTGRVGYRCASPDYLPLVGPVPDKSSFMKNYAALRKNAKQAIACTGDFVNGLYLSTGHGSRGLTSTPLAAEVLASLICGEPLPLSRELYRAISPARFLIRELKRSQPEVTENTMPRSVR
jgi:tRNA 5-methylaminomethyl-2-thiouridine biosynthesis bifunctional protein